VFGIAVSTLLTLVVIPVLYYAVNRGRALASTAPSPTYGVHSMTIESWVRAFAGSFVLLSLVLGAPGSPLFHSIHWLWFTAFVARTCCRAASPASARW